MAEQLYPLESLENIELAQIQQLETHVVDIKRRLADRIWEHFEDIYQKAADRVEGREKFVPMSGGDSGVKLYFPTVAVQRYPDLVHLPTLAQVHIRDAHFEYNAEVMDFLFDHPTYSTESGNEEYYSIDISHCNIGVSMLRGSLTPHVKFFDEEKTRSVIGQSHQYQRAGSDNEAYLWTIQILGFTRWVMEDIPSGYLGRGETGRPSVKWTGIGHP